MAPRSRIIGCGSYLPKRVLTNDELARKLDTSDEWITARTGIRQRHIAAEGELTSDLACLAARQALAAAAIDAEELDLIVLATTTPDNTFPATATKVQALLDVNHGAAFDVQAVCTGFLFALSTADSFIRTGQARTALVLGAETFSRIVDWRDRSTCILFGDGAGAVVLRASEAGDGDQERGSISSHLHSDGRLGELLFVDGGPSSTQTVGTVKMSGRDVFKHAVANLAGVALEALEANGMTIDDIDWLVPHQANKRIIVAPPLTRISRTVSRKR